MNQNVSNFAIMFADVAGSSRLYETVGDAQAQDYIAQCFALMTEVVTQNEGVVIKTIGDEVMCRFLNADAAVQAACKINEGFKGLNTDSGVRLSVRIGLHYGPAILENGDLFGDAVNIAARMVSIAKSKQIITTEGTIKSLSPEYRLSTRRFDCVTVKGKEEKITIYEVLWEWDGLTIMGSIDMPFQSVTSYLSLTYEDVEKHVEANSPAFVIGRDPRCNLIVKTKMASRIHANVEYKREKFVFIDQSTNGTYIRVPDGQNIYLRREGLPLWGKGVISLGENITDNNIHLIHYECP